MLGAFMVKNYVKDGVMDASFANCYAAIKALKAHIAWVGKAPRTASPLVADERGNAIRDLKQERIDRQRAADQEARERSTKQSLVDQAKDAAQRVAANQGIENLRAEVASFTAHTPKQRRLAPK